MHAFAYMSKLPVTISCLCLHTLHQRVRNRQVCMKSDAARRASEAATATIVTKIKSYPLRRLLLLLPPPCYRLWLVLLHKYAIVAGVASLSGWGCGACRTNDRAICCFLPPGPHISHDLRCNAQSSTIHTSLYTHTDRYTHRHACAHTAELHGVLVQTATVTCRQVRRILSWYALSASPAQVYITTHQACIVPFLP